MSRFQQILGDRIGRVARAASGCSRMKLSWLWASRRVVLLPLLVAGLSMTACPRGKSQTIRRCTQAYEQCQLEGGPLGVCQEVTCSAGQAPPCFNCVSQH